MFNKYFLRANHRFSFVQSDPRKSEQNDSAPPFLCATTNFQTSRVKQLIRGTFEREASVNHTEALASISRARVNTRRRRSRIHRDTIVKRLTTKLNGRSLAILAGPRGRVACINDRARLPVTRCHRDSREIY